MKAQIISYFGEFVVSFKWLCSYGLHNFKTSKHGKELPIANSLQSL